MSFTYVPQRERWRSVMLLAWKKGDLLCFDADGNGEILRRIMAYAAPAWPTDPVRKLSVNLIGTYTKINQLYYQEKKKWTGNFTWRENQKLVLNGRYDLKKQIGSGAFGVVMEGIDMQTGESVAIKIIKARNAYTQQAQREIRLLQGLRALDTENTSNVVELRSHFMYHQHQCLVFEMLSANLYTLLERVSFHGFSLPLVRKFANQLFVSLQFLSRDDVKVIHTDIKPENICIRNSKRSAIKLIDFGSSCQEGQRLFAYIQSRYYRSPEVLLNLEYSVAIDTWSLACVLVEMHTGKPLFSGNCADDQLRKIMQVCGMPSDAMVDAAPQKTRAKFFERVEAVGSGGHTRRWRARDGIQTTRRLSDILGVYTGGPEGRWRNEDGQPQEGHTTKHYEQFMDLIQKMLTVDPKRRIKPSEALAHPFLAPLATSNANKGVAAATADPRGASAQPYHSHGRRSSAHTNSTAHAGGQSLPTLRRARGRSTDVVGGKNVGGGAEGNVRAAGADGGQSHVPSSQVHGHLLGQGQGESGGTDRSGSSDPTVHISRQHQAHLSSALQSLGCPDIRLLHQHSLNWEVMSELLRRYTSMDVHSLAQVKQLFDAFVEQPLRARRDKALQELLELLRAHHPQPHSHSLLDAPNGSDSASVLSTYSASVDELAVEPADGDVAGAQSQMEIDNSSSPAP